MSNHLEEHDRLLMMVFVQTGREKGKRKRSRMRMKKVVQLAKGQGRCRVRQVLRILACGKQLIDRDDVTGWDAAAMILM